MITVNGINIDFDTTRTKDAEKLESAKPELTRVATVLQDMGNSASFSTIAEVTIKAVATVLGEDMPKTLNMNADNWVECVEIFAAIQAQTKQTQERINKYSNLRLV